MTVAARRRRVEPEPFERIYLDCAASTYAELLRQARLDFRVLGDHWDYTWDPAAARWPLGRLATGDRGYDQVLRDWYGIDEHVRAHPSEALLWQHVQARSAAGRVVMVNVDLFGWSRSTFHGVDHYPHRLVVLDADDDEALVVDAIGSNRFTGRVPARDVIEAAWPPGQTQPDALCRDAGLTLEFDVPHDARPPAPDDVAARLRDNVARYRQAQRDGLVRGGAALRELRSALPDYADAPDAELAPELIGKITFFGALATQRQLNSLFVELARDVLGLDLDIAAEGLRESARRWKQMHHVLLFGRRKGHPMGPLLRRTAATVREVEQIEVDVVDCLATYLG